MVEPKAPKARPALPSRISESHWVVKVAGARVGFDRCYFEPHKDRTAWLEREARYDGGGVAVDRKIQARFQMGSWPALTWVRHADADGALEMQAEGAVPAKAPSRGKPARTLPRAEHLLPSAALPLAAAVAAREPGEALRVSVLREPTGEVANDRVLLCDGAQTTDGVDPALPLVRYRLVDASGAVEGTYWVDDQRRVRKIDHGGGIEAYLTTRAEALGEDA